MDETFLAKEFGNFLEERLGVRVVEEGGLGIADRLRKGLGLKTSVEKKELHEAAEELRKKKEQERIDAEDGKRATAAYLAAKKRDRLAGELKQQADEVRRLRGGLRTETGSASNKGSSDAGGDEVVNSSGA